MKSSMTSGIMSHQTSKVPTTLEMDGLFTEEDIKNRFFVMKPCSVCLKFSKQDTRERDKPCSYCGGALGINGRYWASIRTWRGDKKLTLADQKKIGA